jgi:hypothetical protein
MQHDLLLLILAILATYRLSRMIAMEDGPFDLFRLLHQALDETLGEDHWITRGWSCPYCLNVWIAMFAALLVSSFYLPFPLVWFGVAGGAMVIHRLVG